MNTKANQEADDLFDEDAELEIEIVDDVPEDEKPRRAETDAAAEIPDEGDLESYSESVQKRIKKLTFEAKEAARQREAASREREEAVKYARAVHDQNTKLQDQLLHGQSAVVDQAKGRIEVELANAKAAYKAAYELGDSDKLVDAQSRLIDLQGRLTQLQNYRPTPRATEPATQQAPQQAPQQAKPAEVKLDARQKAWLEDNSWYGDNSEMTGFALGVHERLVRDGVDTNSETYYNGIDAAVRKRFADVFSNGREAEVTSTPRRSANVVASAGRSAPSPRRVKLTSTQAALAKRLGLKPEQYAAQLLKDAKNG